MTSLPPCSPLPADTRVVSVHDAEPGTIRAALSYDRLTGQWTEYEVVTAYGVERWQRRDFVLLDEVERDAEAE